MSMSIREIHNEISDHAANVANAMMVQHPVVPNQFLGVFSGAKDGSLSVVFDESMLRLDQEVVDALHEIGMNAIKQALIDRPDLFVGAVLGEARNGLNYFDRHHRVNR
jgi:hypothetical protein